MTEETVFFKAGTIALEGRVCRASKARGMVVTHPHPQMGGTMANNVVDALVAAFRQRDVTTLRFNFRGAGRSEGAFDNGEGEQDDVLAALSFLAAEGIDNITLAGYSFGSWVNARLKGRGKLFARHVMVSPPIDFLSFGSAPPVGDGDLVICGDRDQFCPVDRLRKLVDGSGARLEIVPGADHFYLGYEESVAKLVMDYLDDAASGGPGA